MEHSENLRIRTANIVFLVVICLYMAFQFVLLALKNFYGLGNFTQNSYSIIIIMEYGLILIPVLIYVFYKGVDLKRFFRIKPIKLTDMFLILFMMLSLSFTGIFLNAAMIYFLGFAGKVPYNNIPVPQNFLQYLIGIFVIAITPAICEESLHRGILLNAYGKMGIQKAVIVTALFFGLFHFDLKNLMAPIVLGGFISYVVIKTQSILAGVLAHFINNFYALTLQYINRNHMQLPDYITVNSQDLTVAFLTAVLFLMAVFMPLLYWFNKRHIDVQESVIPEKSVLSLRQILTEYWPILAICGMYIAVGSIYVFSIARGHV